MTTYASPRLTRVALLVAVTFIFLAGCYMFVVGVFNTINYMGRSSRATFNLPSNDTQPSTKINNSTNMHSIDQEGNEPRFPSTSSPSVEVIFGLVTLGHSMFGIVAVTKERANLLATYGHILVISCFIKMLFLVVSVGMHSVTPKYNFLSSVVSLGILTATTELILVMCVCQFTKLVKRGDAARQEIQSIHSYHLERRSRSRSQSRVRSLYSHNSFVSVSPTPIQSVSRTASFQDLSTMTESVSYYVPPPIYLKLDR